MLIMIYYRYVDCIYINDSLTLRKQSVYKGDYYE